MILNQETREKLTAISLTEIGPNHIKLGGAKSGCNSISD